jgi:ABC-type multidrug transport system fused ATPase/permease subunit
MFRLLGNPALRQILRQTSRQRRIQLNLLMGLLLVGALAELAAIAAVVPFVALVSGSETFGSLQPVFGWIGAGEVTDRLLTVTLLFGAAVLLAGLLRIALAWMTQSFSFGLGYDLGIAIHARLLHQPYAFHTSHNSADLIAAHEKVFAFIHGVVLPVLNGVTAGVTSLFIVAILAYIDPVAASVAAGAIAIVYVGVTWLTRGRLNRYGAIINEAHNRRVQAVQESIGGIRDVLIDHSQEAHLDHFARISRRYSRAEIKAAFVSSSPRFAVEVIGLVLIALLALMISSRSESFAAALPVLGAIALSGQRLLPLLQQVYYGWAQARTGTPAATDLAALLELTIPSAKVEPTPPFRDAIRLNNVHFRYPGRSEWALHNIDLTIHRGARTALVGPSGSGKSTLADLVMGLLEPTAGTISVDGRPLDDRSRRGWQSQIAHVPQSIFLADASIEQNIAFGQPEEKVDRDRVRWAAEIAQVAGFVAALREGYATLLGERGVRLSGGQRQRIGIARALYKRAQVVILDEATSALDRETEVAILREIDAMGDEITLILIAHRSATVDHCNTIVRVDRGTITEIKASRHSSAKRSFA